MSKQHGGYEERNSGRVNSPTFRTPAKPDNNSGRSNTPVFRQTPDSDKGKS